jgi:hypothetical protein
VGTTSRNNPMLATRPRKLHDALPTRASEHDQPSFHEPALGAVDGGLADTDTGSNRGVSGSAIGSQLDLGAFQLACSVMTATQHRPPMFEGTHMNRATNDFNGLADTLMTTRRLG